MQITNKENLMYYMQSGKLQLSHIDMNFVQNLHYNYLQSKPITSNQLNLFDKLIIKYKKQLKKNNLDYQVCLEFKYNGKVIESDVEHTTSQLFLENDKIIFRSPFNKKFLNNLQILSYNPFSWNRDKKRHESNFSTYSLKTIVDLGNKHYNTVSYSDTIKELLKIDDDYKCCKFWQPTLVKINNNFFILAVNENLYEHIKDIELNDSVATLSILSEYGIKIDSTVTNYDKKLCFSGEFFPSVDIKEINDLIEYLKELGCDCIIFSNRLDFLNSIKELKKTLSAVTNNLININDCYNNKKTYNYPVIVHFGTVVTHEKIEKNKVKKVIKIKNSNEISIR